MTRAALLFAPLLLSACLAGGKPAPEAADPADLVRVVKKGPTWNYVANPVSGEMAWVEGARIADSVVVRGPAFDLAVSRLVAYCAAKGVTIGTDWGGDFVYQDPLTYEWWFPDTCA